MYELDEPVEVEIHNVSFYPGRSDALLYLNLIGDVEEDRKHYSLLGVEADISLDGQKMDYYNLLKHMLQTDGRQYRAKLWTTRGRYGAVMKAEFTSRGE